MNRKRTLVFVFIGLAAALIIYFWPRPVAKPPAQQSASSATSSTIIASPSPGVPTVPANTQPINPGKPVAVENQPDTNQQKAYLTAFLTPISFWGKVVDEKGNPVAGATAALGLTNNPNPMGGEGR